MPEHSDVAKKAIEKLPAARVGSIQVERDNLRQKSAEYLRKAEERNAQAEEQRQKQKELDQATAQKLEEFRRAARAEIAKRTRLDVSDPPMSLEDLARLRDRFAPKPITGTSPPRDEIEPSLDPDSEDGKAFVQALRRAGPLNAGRMHEIPASNGTFADTFRGSSYFSYKSTETITLYRVQGKAF